MNFRLKTILGIALIQTVLLLILVISGLNYLAESNELQLRQRALSTVNLFAAATKDAILSTDLATLESEVDEILIIPDIVYARISNDGIVLAQKGNADILDSKREADSSIDLITDGIYDVKAEVRVEGILYGVIEIGLSTSYMDALMIDAKRSAFSVAGAEIILVAIFSFILGTYLTRQLNLLKKATKIISTKGPGHQVDINSDDEIGEVAQAFNSMSSDLKILYTDLEDNLEAYKGMADIARRNEAMNKAIISSSLDAIITIDSKGLIVEFNHIAEQIFGWTREQAKGRNISETIIPESYREAHIQGMNHYMETNEGPVLGKRLELEAINKQGIVFPIEISISPINNADETLFTAFIRDLSEAKAAEVEQKLARKQAELASEAKSRFLATVSHEIRSPLNAIMSMNTLLMESNLDVKQAEIAQTVNEGGEILMSLINDILDFSKIESGRLKLHNEWFDLVKTLKGTINLLTNQSNLDQVTVDSSFSGDLYQSYYGDQIRVRQVLINLLSNAIKFTESGTVTVALGQNQSNGGITLSVTDTGIGISQDQMDFIFTEFTQVDDQDNRRFGGTGLGLSIVNQLVKLMGGEISVTSEKLKGACFTVDLPLDGSNEIYPEDISEAEPLENSDFSKMNTLLAEDSPTNRKVVEAILSGMGVNVETAENGEQAVSLAQTKKYDLILMDLAMPVMDGLEATRIIRRGNELNRDTQIIAITANAFGEDRERCLAAGMNDFVSKPIHIPSFRSKMQRWLQQDQSSESAIIKSQMIDSTVFGQLQRDTGKQVLPGILNIFIEECNKRLSVMKSGHEKRNWKTLEDEAHALKSSSGSFGAIKLQAFAREIELAAINKNIDTIDKIMPTLDDLIHLSIAELETLISQS